MKTDSLWTWQGNDHAAGKVAGAGPYNMSRRQLGAMAASIGLAPWLGVSGCATLATPGRALPRVLVSTDIGGTDPDDFQSMVHLLVCADRLDLEGLVSSPFGPGRKRHILEVIEKYERDYPSLSTYSPHYPSPDRLRGMTKQGALDSVGYSAVAEATEGSDWIVRCARRPDPRPLHVLVWGGIDDLAQALHDAPDILPRLRVYFIGGPNKKWSADAYQYIADQHRDLWIIEANSTYRGWFVGGDQSGDWGNARFTAARLAGQGALGDYFTTHLGGTIKMGDSPSVGWVLSGPTDDPTRDSWGGRFVRAWDRPHAIFTRLTTAADRIEQFGVMEWRLPVEVRAGAAPTAIMVYENQRLPGHWDGAAMRFRCCPREIKVNTFRIESDLPTLEGLTGAFTSFPPPASSLERPSATLPNWWTDDPSEAQAEGEHQGARSVSRFRHAFLEDFAVAIARCATPATSAAR